MNFSHLKIVGLVGGIGSGKSTVGKAFEDLGADRLDADKIAGEVLGEPEIVAALKDAFGPHIFDDQNQLDRAVLADEVFAPGKEENLAQLNQIVHPRVRQKMAERLVTLDAEKSDRVVILDVPLLAESPLKSLCQYIVFVDTDRSLRLERVRENRGWSEEELARREERQMELDKKRQLSHYTVVNNGTESDLRDQVAKIWDEMR